MLSVPSTLTYWQSTADSRKYFYCSAVEQALALIATSLVVLRKLIQKMATAHSIFHSATIGTAESGTNMKVNQPNDTSMRTSNDTTTELVPYMSAKSGLATTTLWCGKRLCETDRQSDRGSDVVEEV